MNQMQEPIVATHNGKIKGFTGKNLIGEEYLQFLGIPYGSPPIGNLRFKPPQPVSPWEGIRDATTVGNASVQKNDMKQQIIGSEDCLYLNVFTRKLANNDSKPRPVMVYIHGGGFNKGYPNPEECGPEFLMMKDIVLVTLNYRLGALGFLSIEGTDVMGNMGLKDQNLALKWIRRNIECFNGDSNNVTLFGESAGAAAIHAHILSPTSKGLFHKAILQSGCLLNSWAIGSKNNARKLVANMGISASSEEQALEILKHASEVDICSAQEKFLDYPHANLQRLFCPVVETPNDTSFLSEDPREIIKKGEYNQVPIIIGYTDIEGMIIELFEKSDSKIPKFEMKCAIPHDLNISEGSDENKQICSILQNVYSLRSDDNSRYHALTDSSFLVGIVETILSQLKTTRNPIYLYRMTITTQLNFLKGVIQSLDEPGVCHADDLGYLFYCPRHLHGRGIESGTKEDKYIRIFVDLWTSFAELGSPTLTSCPDITWEPIEGKDNLKVLEIGEIIEMKDLPERRRMETWWDIYAKYSVK